MARNLGSFDFSANLEVKIKGMLDARTFVPTYADLLLYTPSNYLFNGFIVAVWDADATKRGIYQLVDENNLNLEASWVNLSGSGQNIPANLQTIIDDFEARITALESYDITLTNRVGVAESNISGNTVDITNIKNSLPNKADLVSGKVPQTQLPLLGTTRAYATIAARNADTNLTGVVLGLVIDASADTANAVTGTQLYVNTDTGWKLYQGATTASFTDGYNAAPIVADLTVGAWNVGESLAAGSKWEAAFNKLLNKTYVPTFTAPSFSLSNNAGSVREIGEVIGTFNLTFNFNKGSINGALSGGIWDPALSQNFRAGNVNGNGYNIHGVIQSSNTLAVLNHAVINGANNFSATVTYLAGPQPTNSKGANYDSPLAAGTSPSQITSFEGVYPLFASTTNITTSTKQPLVSMLTGNNIELELVAESGGNKQFFKIADAWVGVRPIVAIYYYNTVSQSYSTVNKLEDFTSSVSTETVSGVSIPYTKLTHNKSDRGAIKIKLVF